MRGVVGALPPRFAPPVGRDSAVVDVDERLGFLGARLKNGRHELARSQALGG